MGSRSVANAKAVAWAEANGKNASSGTFKDAVGFGDIIFNCTKGESALEVFELAGIDQFNGKVIVDVSNPLDFSRGMPPALIPQYTNTHSLSEEFKNCYLEPML